MKLSRPGWHVVPPVHVPHSGSASPLTHQIAAFCVHLINPSMIYSGSWGFVLLNHNHVPFLRICAFFKAAPSYPIAFYTPMRICTPQNYTQIDLHKAV